MDQDSLDAPPDGTPFDEAWYLRHYPGIAEAIQNGGFRSAWHHYVACGRAEGREGVPRSRAAAAALSAGGSTADKMALTRLAYKLLLGREELDDNIVSSQSDFTDIYELRRRFLNSPEHVQNDRIMELARLLYRDEAAIAQATQAFEAFARQPPESEQLIARLTEAAGESSEYAYFHARRFSDQIRAAAAIRHKRLAYNPRVRLLDVGQAPVTTMYAQVIPGMELYTANLQGGATADNERAKYGSAMHYFVDFDSETLSERYPELTAAPFDIIVFCEVIEHIRASPEEQIRDLLNILAPGGALIVSTPNAMSYGRIRKLAADRKWDSVYSRKNRAHHEEHHIHVREFTITEMLEAVRDAGGELMMMGVADYYTEPQGAMVRLNYVSSREVQTLIIKRAGT